MTNLGSCKQYSENVYRIKSETVEGQNIARVAHGMKQHLESTVQETQQPSQNKIAPEFTQKSAAKTTNFTPKKLESN